MYSRRNGAFKHQLIHFYERETKKNTFSYCDKFIRYYFLHRINQKHLKSRQIYIMNSHTKYLVFGPKQSLQKMGDKLLSSLDPKFVYEYQSPVNKDHIFVAVFEEYEKQINSSVTLTLVFEKRESQNVIYLKKTGGRMGFRGSSLSEEKTVEHDVIEFIFDYTKRYGLTLQEEKVMNEEEEN